MREEQVAFAESRVQPSLELPTNLPRGYVHRVTHHNIRDGRADSESLLRIGALLPFAKNRFVVRSYDWALVPNYLQNGLNPTQIRAIQHLIVRCTTVRPELSPGVALAQWSGLKTFEVVVKLGLSPELVVASLKTTSSTSAHNSSGKSRVPSVHVGVDFSNGWQPRTNNQRLGPPDSRTIDGIRSWQRGLESTLVVLPEQQRVEREAKEKAQKIAELAEEQAQKEQRAAVRSTRGLRNLEKKS
jgi:hypothetical protein